MTRLAAVLALAAGPAWAGDAQPVVSLEMKDAAWICVIIFTAAGLAAEKRVIALRVLGVVWLVIWIGSAAFADAYDEPGGWSDLVCPPGIETVQLDALDPSPDAGVLLPPGLDPERFVTPEPRPVTPAGLTPPTQPAEPGETTPVALPWAALMMFAAWAALAVAGWTMGLRR